MDLSGKRILITGASSGIGRAAAIRCGELGARLVLSGRDRARLEETLSLLPGEGHALCPMDLAAGKDLEEMFRGIAAEGKLSGLLHCAGIPGVMPLGSLTRERLQGPMEIHFYAFVELVRQFSKKKYSLPGGSAVAVSSVLVHRPRPYELAYIASKGAMEAAIPPLAMECAKKGIRVNAVVAGPVRTPMALSTAARLGSEETMEENARAALLGWSEPEEVAEALAFLLSDSAGKITGRCLFADGGVL